MRKEKLLIFLFVFVYYTSLFAQQTFKIWEDTEMTHKQKWSELSVFLPEKEHNTGIAVIISPGGSYYWLDMDNEGYAVAKYLNKKGITAFVLHYRTARIGNNHYPAMIQDLQRAIQLVKENAEKYGIDPEKLGVMGFSAGGHLSGTAAEYFDVNFMRELGVDPKVSLKPAFAGMIYPVVSMEDSICHQKSRRNLLGNKRTPEMEQMMSLEQNVREEMSPIFILHLTGDKTVDYRNSVVMDQALTKKKIKHFFHLIDENGHGGHGFGIQPNGKATGWIDVFVEWVFDVVISD